MAGIIILLAAPLIIFLCDVLPGFPRQSTKDVTVFDENAKIISTKRTIEGGRKSRRERLHCYFSDGYEYSCCILPDESTIEYWAKRKHLRLAYKHVHNIRLSKKEAEQKLYEAGVLKKSEKEELDKKKHEKFEYDRQLYMASCKDYFNKYDSLEVQPINSEIIGKDADHPVFATNPWTYMDGFESKYSFAKYQWKIDGVDKQIPMGNISLKVYKAIYFIGRKEYVLYVAEAPFDSLFVPEDLEKK